MSPDRQLLDWRLTLNDQHLTTPMGAEVEKLGLLRGTLHIATYGAVSAKSKKQRTASMQLAAMQGKGQAAIKAAGGRNFDFVNQANYRAKQLSEQRKAANRADPEPLSQQPDPAAGKWKWPDFRDGAPSSVAYFPGYR